MSRDGKDEEMIYGLTIDEREALQQGLHALPATMPPRAVWHRIREQAEAEGLIRKPRSQRPSTWYLFSGVAAAAVLSAVIVPGMLEEQAGGDSYTTPPPVVNRQTSLDDLRVQSAQLERDLRSLPDEPRVVRAGTRAAILEIEDRIAAIDYQLSDPEVQLTPEEEEVFWRERVRLMKSLVGLRYAQAQRTAF